MRCAAPSALAFLAALAFLGGCGEKDEPEVTGPPVGVETSTTSTTTTSAPGGNAP